MPFAQSNGITLCYDTFGDHDDPTMLLIMGLGEQLLAWPDGFCELLAGRGFHVVRFDNRDVGLSTWCDELGDADIRAVFTGDLSTVRYRLSDMAADTAGLIEALGVAPAHLVGVSMGGGIAQQVAIDHPELVASLASIMSTTSNPALRVSDPLTVPIPQPSPVADREEVIAAEVALYHLIGSPGFDIGDEELRRRAAAKFDRAFHPAGTLRQAAANVTAPDRTEGLGALRMPAVVIHGDSDRLVDPLLGRATADAIPGADLLIVPGMGHDLPEGAWKVIVDAIVSNATRT